MRHLRPYLVVAAIVLLCTADRIRGCVRRAEIAAVRKELRDATARLDTDVDYVFIVAGRNQGAIAAQHKNSFAYRAMRQPPEPLQTRIIERFGLAHRRQMPGGLVNHLKGSKESRHILGRE